MSCLEVNKCQLHLTLNGAYNVAHLLMERKHRTAHIASEKNIHFLVRELSYGGVIKSLVPIIEALCKQGWTVTISVATHRQDLSTAKTIFGHSAKVVFPLVPKTRFYSWALCKSNANWKRHVATRPFWHLMNKIEYFRQIIVYSRLPKHHIVVGFQQGPLSRIAIRWAKGQRKILWYHNDIIDEECLEKDFRKAERIVVNTEQTKATLLKHWPHISFDQIIVFPCLVDPREIESKAGLFVPNLPNGVINIVTVGRVSWEKGQNIALSAASLLKKAGIAFHWFFIGGWPTNDLSEYVLQERLEKNVTFLPQQDNPYPYIAACDLFVLPSIRESYGIVISEAMILGRPVVATKTVGAQSQIENLKNGLLADINPQSLYETVLKLIINSSLRERICASLQAIKWGERLSKGMMKISQIFNHTDVQ